MSLSLTPSADGKVDLHLGSTLIATFSTNGVEGGTLLADAATAQGLANALKLLTPATLDAAFEGSNQSLSSSGYQRLPGGLIIQWGTIASLPSPTNPIVFPISFPNASFISAPNIADTDSNYYFSQAVSVTTSGFTAVVYGNGSGSSPTGSGTGTKLFWIALGY